MDCLQVGNAKNLRPEIEGERCTIILIARDAGRWAPFLLRSLHLEALRQGQGRAPTAGEMYNACSLLGQVGSRAQHNMDFTWPSQQPPARARDLSPHCHQRGWAGT
eukprot:jgi/Botrbrau1/819/Bobra.0352s0016.1